MFGVPSRGVSWAWPPAPPRPISLPAAAGVFFLPEGRGQGTRGSGLRWGQDARSTLTARRPRGGGAGCPGARGPDGRLAWAWGTHRPAGRGGRKLEPSWGRDQVGGPQTESGGGPSPGAHDGAPAPPRARPLPGPGEETRRF